MNIRFALAACMLLAASAAPAAQPPAPTIRYATRAVDASRISHRNFIGGINNRLTVVHEIAYDNPESPDAPLDTALYEPVDRLWVGGIHSTAEQTGDGGFKFIANGVNTGFDWTQGDLTIGLAANFTLGTVKNNELDVKNKIESANFGLYASHDPLYGLFYDVNATYGMSWNRSLSWEVAGGNGSREGRFRAVSYGLGGNIGYGFDLPLAKITPSIGFQWTRHTQDAYTEQAGGIGVAPHWFDEAENDLIEIPLAVRVGTSWQTGGGAVFSPELRAAYVLRAGDRQFSTTMGTAGNPAPTILHGADDGKNLARVGVGLKANFSPAIDAFVDYSLEFKSGYRSSNLNTGLGASF